MSCETTIPAFRSESRADNSQFGVETVVQSHFYVHRGTTAPRTFGVPYSAACCCFWRLITIKRA